MSIQNSDSLQVIFYFFNGFLFSYYGTLISFKLFETNAEIADMSQILISFKIDQNDDYTKTKT